MTLETVSSPEAARAFLLFPVELYKDDRNYVRPLDEDVEQVFDPLKNPFLAEGEAGRWLLRTDAGEVIGRIAAFVNPSIAYSEEYPTGGIGFFDCIDNRAAAFMLFDAAVDWLRERKMEAADGPVNFGNREKWWGVLAEGMYTPNYCCNYNFPYYTRLFEEYGFNLYYRQYTYRRMVNDPLSPLLTAIAGRVKRNPAYSFRHISLSKLDQYMEDFHTIYNRAWKRHKAVAELSTEQAIAIGKAMKPVIDERLIWFAYYQEEPVAFFVSLPELNRLFVSHSNGRLNWEGKIRLLFNKWTGACKTMFGIVFGVVPEHQRKGVEIALIAEAAKAIQHKVPYTEVEMNWIGDFNPKMMSLAGQIGASIHKVHHTYRYLFDRKREFVRHPEI
jgi:GNAT superfamily N-acetyltransferase